MSEVNDDEDYGFDEEIKKYEESVQSDNKDDDDDIFDDQQNTVDEHNDDDDFFDEQNAEVSSGSIPDIVMKMLQNQGIKDPNKIKYEDEEGNEVSVSWNDIPDDDKINILRGVEDNNDINEDENVILNSIKESKLTPAQWYEAVRNDAIREYIDANKEEAKYDVDDMTDDELYILDMKANFPNMEDEKIMAALQADKEAPMFNERVNRLRDSYIQMERDANAAEEQAGIEQAQEQEKTVAHNVANAVEQLTNIGGIEIELDDDEKDVIYNMVVMKDYNNKTMLQKAIENPAVASRVSWFLNYGDKAFGNMLEQVDKTSKIAYRKGITDAKSGRQPTAKVIYKKSERPSSVAPNKKIKTIDDLW